MSVFGDYSHYYNLLYKDKDYQAEVNYIQSLICRFHPNTGSILDIGCGTGQHAIFLLNYGYFVYGVDKSKDMFLMAQKAREALPGNKAKKLFFSQGDARSFRLGEVFDVSISLFHVMSYQSSNKDIEMAFKTASLHLKPGGLFIFDCWYGPAVLSERPMVRIKVIEDDETEIIRIAEPVMHPNEDIVDVNYRILILDKATKRVKELMECHRMRYLFKPEVENFLQKADFQLEFCAEYSTNREPGFDTWSVCFVARKKNLN